VARPGRLGDVDGDIVFAQELGDELEGEPDSTGAGETLHEGDLVVEQGLEGGAVVELDGLLAEGLESTDGEVLMVHVLVVDLLTGPLHTVQHPRLPIVISVGSHSQVHFLFVFALLKGHTDA